MSDALPPEARLPPGLAKLAGLGEPNDRKALAAANARLKAENLRLEELPRQQACWYVTTALRSLYARNEAPLSAAEEAAFMREWRPFAVLLDVERGGFSVLTADDALQLACALAFDLGMATGGRP